MSAENELRDLQESILQSRTLGDFMAVKRTVEIIRQLPNEAAPEHVPTLAQIKANLLHVRSHTHFNIGSPQAIDHLLISLVAVIDAILAGKTITPSITE